MSRFDPLRIIEVLARNKDLAASAVVVDVGGHDVGVAALADVVRSKQAAGRPKDAVTLPTLRQWMDVLQGVGVDDLRRRMQHVLAQVGADGGESSPDHSPEGG